MFFNKKKTNYKYLVYNKIIVSNKLIFKYLSIHFFKNLLFVYMSYINTFLLVYII